MNADGCSGGGRRMVVEGEDGRDAFGRGVPHLAC